MKTLRLVIFLVLALVQVSVPASMIWKRQRTLREGRVWKFRTAPVDPVDAMRGRYLILSFTAERFRWDAPLTWEDKLFYVTLKEEDGFAVVESVSYEPRSGDNVVRAENYGYYEGHLRIGFPFDRFWLSEGDAQAAEAAYMAHSRPESANAYALVRVTNGDAAIEDIYIADQPLREYLRKR
ncbi:MAG TPA: GDYXXLXY domain-containing protein [Chthoniobacterales bacterium]|nr:GDYXXLXY domain-containing protein [Chthoniobacterales bacterium]